MTALQKVNLGTPPTGTDGDTVRTANAKANANVDVLSAQVALTSATTITASQGLTTDHIGKRVNFNSASAITVNLPAASTCAQDQVTLLRNLGTGVVTLAVAVGSGDTLNLSKLNPGESALFDTDGVHAWTVLMRGRATSDNEAVDGNQSVGGSLTVAGSVAAAGGFAVGTVASISAAGAYSGASAAYSGAVTAGSLGVAGTATVGALSSNGNASVGTLGVTGAAAVGSLSVGAAATVGSLTVNGAATVTGKVTCGGSVFPLTSGSQGGVAWNISNTTRWQLFIDGSPETGSNGGTNFALGRFSDNGTWLGTCLGVTRATGVCAFRASSYPINLTNTAAPGVSWNTGPDGAGAFCIFNGSNTGVFLSSGSTTWGTNSDARLKNIKGTIDDALARVASIRSVFATWKSDDPETAKPFPCFIAQDVQQVLPEVVDVREGGILGIRYSEMVPLAFAAINELRAALEAANSRIAALEAA